MLTSPPGLAASLLRLLLSCRARQRGRRLPGDGAGTPGASASSRGQAAPRLLSCRNLASPGRCVPPAAPLLAPGSSRSSSHRALRRVAAAASGHVPAGRRWPWGDGPPAPLRVGFGGRAVSPGPGSTHPSVPPSAGPVEQQPARRWVLSGAGAGWATCGGGPGAVLSQNIPG